MKGSQIVNARIERTILGYEDHGIMTACLYLDYSGAGQMFGGYALDGKPVDREKGRVPTPLCGAFIANVLRVTGVGSWEKVAGTYIRVDCDLGQVHGIGHLLKDDWFYPADLLER